MEDFMTLEFWQSLFAEYVPNILMGIATLIIGFWIAGLITRSFRKIMVKREVDASLISFLGSLASILLKVIVLISVAGVFGVETASFIAVLGAMAFAVGMALQGTLGHFASGVLILIFRYYRVGDFVEVNGISGTVKDIQIFNTTLTALDNRIITVPNGLITGNNIINFTANDIRRVDMTFGIGYADDIDKAKASIKKVIESCEGILQDQPFDIFVKELADSSVNFAVRVWVNTPDYWAVYFEMQEKVKKEFDGQGISIPFPQMDLHMIKE